MGIAPKKGGFQCVILPFMCSVGFRGAPWGSVGFRGGLFWPFPPIIQALAFLCPNSPPYRMEGAPKPVALTVFAGGSLAFVGMRT